MKNKKEVFTPLLNSKNGKRLKFDMEKEINVIWGSLEVRKLGLKAIIEVGNITPYAVYGCDCGLKGCECDSYIKLIK